MNCSELKDAEKERSEQTSKLKQREITVENVSTLPKNSEVARNLSSPVESRTTWLQGSKMVQNTESIKLQI